MPDMEQISIAFVETPLEIVDLMVKLIGKPLDSRVLDAGCGKGSFLSKLVAENYTNVEGIEMNEERYEYCSKMFPKLVMHHDDFLSWKPSGRYDVIIGNPPYMHYNELPPNAQKRVTEITKSMESDIYYAFVVRAIEMLADGGELIFIVPYGFFYNTYADVVRTKILRSGYLDVVIDLDESRLFKDAHPETIIFKLVKSKKRPLMRVARVKTRVAKAPDILEKAWQALKQGYENDLFAYHNRAQFRTYDPIWSTRPEIEIPEYQFIEHIASVNVGLLAGYSEGFSLTNEEYDTIPKDERDVVFPFVKSKHCEGFWTDGSSWRILLEGKVNAENELAERYPTIYRKLLAHKKEMSNRYLPNDIKWFRWLALRNKESIDAHIDDWKIFVPTLDRHQENRFSMTRDRVYAEGDTIFIVPTGVNPFFLLGYLNSRFFREYYLSRGARRGHRIAYTQAVLSKCKIPAFSTEVMKQIGSIAKDIFDSRDHSRREEMNALINNAFEEGEFRKVGMLKFFT